MDDYDDDFCDDNFSDDGEFADGDFDDPFDLDGDDLDDDWCGTDEVEPDEDIDGPGDQRADFTWKEAFVLGGAMGLAYEEGLEKRKSRKPKKRKWDES